MYQLPVRLLWLGFALVLLSASARDIRAESTIVLKNSNRDEGRVITLFVKASSKSWDKAVQMELAPGESRRLRLASDDTFNIAVRNADGVILIVDAVKKWEATSGGFGGEFVPFGKQNVDLHKILSERARGETNYHLIFKDIGKGKSPSDFKPKEGVAPGGEMGSIDVTPRTGTLTFPAVFG